MQALSNIKVLDLTRLLPGPYCSMILGDFGAEVIKIEQPGAGDYSRTYKPLRAGVGYRFLLINRNKKSLTLDLKTTQGKEIFYQLVKTADVVLDSFRPGVMDKMGLGYNDLQKLNDRIICCSLTGFGQTGPYVNNAGHDLNYISLAGITGLTGKKGGSPIIPGVQIADFTGGLSAALGIMIAINSKNISGKGQFVDVSLFNSALSLLASDASVYFGSGYVPGKGRTRLTGGWPHYNIYKAKDNRYMAVGALEEKFWVNFCQALNREELIGAIDCEGDEKKQKELSGILKNIFKTKTAAQWEALLENKDTCVTVVKNLGEVFADPHVKANEMVVDLFDAELGAYKQLGIPIKLSATPGALNTKAPKPGEHNQKILSALGYSAAQIAKLAERKVI